jgi:hypothetical protein
LDKVEQRMNGLATKFIAAGTRVKVKTPGIIPTWSVWDFDGHRVANSVKRRLQQLFFTGDRRVTATLVYISSESERERLRRDGRVKVEVRNAAGNSVVITAGAEDLQAA